MSQLGIPENRAERSPDEINLEELELELLNAKKRVENKKMSLGVVAAHDSEMQAKDWPSCTSSSSNLHSLLLLSDSALPLGAFAFSSGLESLIAHKTKQKPKDALLSSFLIHSIASVAGLSLPYLLEAHRRPDKLMALDNDFDASTPCTVARRASVAQGKALLTIWEKSFKSASKISGASQELSRLSKAQKKGDEGSMFEISAHLPPVFGSVARAFDVDERTAAYTFLLNHTKAVLSAAVRAGILGPFQAQAFLTSDIVRKEIEQRIDVAAKNTVQGAGQVWVSGDIWLGRHELLYSRIFNS